MLIFIPLCSVLYTLLRDEVNERLKRKVKEKEETQCPVTVSEDGEHNIG